MEGLTLGGNLGVLPGSESGYAVQCLDGIELDTGCLDQGGVEIVVDDRLGADLACGHLSLGPTDDEWHPNATLVELAFTASQRGVGGDLQFAAIVA